jgi:RHS repeat-associated protein
LGVGPFTGKELDSETSLQYFGARYYMAALGRWGQVDPLADQYAGYSPYSYVLGNPNSFVDPDGRAVACPMCIGFGIGFMGSAAAQYLTTGGVHWGEATVAGLATAMLPMLGPNAAVLSTGQKAGAASVAASVAVVEGVTTRSIRGTGTDRLDVGLDIATSFIPGPVEDATRVAIRNTNRATRDITREIAETAPERTGRVRRRTRARESIVDRMVDSPVGQAVIEIKSRIVGAWTSLLGRSIEGSIDTPLPTVQ